jgi:predicted lysophospholipase L1 biosynthesis ABC-type transport system permease subunit
MVDEIGKTLTFAVERLVPVLPAVLDSGVMVNLNSLESQLPGFPYEAAWEVWLGRNAPPDALARLRAAGLDPGTVHSEATRVQQLSRQAPALALLLLLGCAVAGAVLAAGGTAISISAGGRRRSYELAALRAVGADRAALVRAGVLEQLLLLGSAVVLGVPAGLLAARLAMPVIPEFADPTPITLHYSPQWVPTVAFAAAFVVVLVITAFVAGRALLRAAVSARLREAEA